MFAFDYVTDLAFCFWILSTFCRFFQFLFCRLFSCFCFSIICLFPIGNVNSSQIILEPFLSFENEATLTEEIDDDDDDDDDVIKRSVFLIALTLV